MDPTDYDIQRFLTAYPAALDHICYMLLDGADEPQMMMNLEAVKMFAAWSVDQGRMTLEEAAEFVMALASFRHA